MGERDILLHSLAKLLCSLTSLFICLLTKCGPEFSFTLCPCFPDPVQRLSPQTLAYPWKPAVQLRERICTTEVSAVSCQQPYALEPPE